ncbi:element excision factor XisI family protein [Microcoleus sp. Pol11C1]|uniref:element excision factor XisI family protein n=1 Tax=unclassified Microcoleus TaxID=2642155 RepID=UPI002FD596E8
MDSLKEKYRQIIQKILEDYAAFLGQEDGIQQELIFDQEHDRYLLLETGWYNRKRIYGSFRLRSDLLVNFS